MIAIAVLFLITLYVMARIGFALLALVLGVLGLLARGLLALAAPRRRMVR